MQLMNCPAEFKGCDKETQCVEGKQWITRRREWRNFKDWYSSSTEGKKKKITRAFNGHESNHYFHDLVTLIEHQMTSTTEKKVIDVDMEDTMKATDVTDEAKLITNKTLLVPYPAYWKKITDKGKTSVKKGV